MNSQKKATIISSLALFSMFFGAGNMIFPPLLGLNSGYDFSLASIGFLLSSVGIVLSASVASIKSGGTILSFSEKCGKTFSLIFSTSVILAIGPLLAIPRTAATTHEIIEGTIIPNLPPLLSSIIFFSLVLFFVLSKKNVIDVLGKGLTPALLFVLILILYKGISSPLGTPSTPSINNAFSSGFMEGYQTMDALAALIFMGIVKDGLMKKGFTSKKDLVTITKKSALIAGFNLAIVYGGLLYIGATMSSLNLKETHRVSLLIFATNSLLGVYGKFALSLAISLACLTTAIGLTTTVGDYFEEISKGKIKRQYSVIASTVLSIFLSVKGVEAIIKIAGNILTVIYPVAIVLIFLNLFPERFPKKSTWKGACIGAFIIPFFAMLNKTFFQLNILEFFKEINPNVLTFAWIIPALLFGEIFTHLNKQTKKALP